MERRRKAILAWYEVATDNQKKLFREFILTKNCKGMNPRDCFLQDLHEGYYNFVPGIFGEL